MNINPRALGIALLAAALYYASPAQASMNCNSEYLSKSRERMERVAKGLGDKSYVTTRGSDLRRLAQQLKLDEITYNELAKQCGLPLYNVSKR